MTSPGRDSTDDELYRWLIESLRCEGQRYAHEVEDGDIEVIFACEGDLGRVQLLLTRQQLRRLVPTDDASGDSAGRAARRVSLAVDEAVDALLVDEVFVVLFEGRFVGSTRRELPPIPGVPDQFEAGEGGFWSAYADDDPRFGGPGSILGSRPDGETDRLSLAMSMDPVLDDGRYVFCEVEGVSADAVISIREEGVTTLVVEQQVADENGWRYSMVTAMVVLRVHNTFGDVDLIAEITGALSERGISCRMVAGLRNDRLFVPHDRGWDVLQALEDLRDVLTGTGLRSAEE